ncbi:unnamed protein product [Phytophthora fragariaefolia]|uniref:Unnamed protein product n=1 Tax=Phytophthora fragariaefolia TaxID=1490495 RepID=A0A9W6Y5H9_9STRA|nr:unnamed protein product [Phytophthora fragariaefolia]
MAPPSTSVGAGGDSPSPILALPVDALSPGLGAAPRSTVDAPEAALGADSADSQPQGSVSNSGGSDDGARSAANAPEASSAALGASRVSSVRWEDIEDILTAGTDRTVRQVQESAQSHFLALARLVVDLYRRPPLHIDYELHQRLEAAGSLLDVVDALAPVPRSPGPWEYELTELLDDAASLEARLAASEASLRRERCHRPDKSLADIHNGIRHDREQFKTGISSCAAQLRQLREYLERSDRQSSVSGGTSSASASAMPAAFATFLEELGALQLVIPLPPSASGSSEASVPAPPVSSGASGGATATSGSSTSLTVDSDTSDYSGPVIPSSPHKGKGKRPAKSSSKLQSQSLLPKNKQRLGRPSVDLKARKAANQAASAAASSSGSSQNVLPSPLVTSASTPSTPVSGIAVSADSDVLSFAAFPGGSDPPFSPIPRTPASPASSTASTASLPSTPVVSRGITRGTEASVPVEIDDDGGSGADGAASEASVAPGGVFSSPVASQPRRNGRPTRAASTTAGLRSMAAAENEAAPDALWCPRPGSGGDIGFGASSSGQHPHAPDSSSSCGDGSDPSASLDSDRPGSGYSNPVRDAWDSVYSFRACDRNPGFHSGVAASGSEPARRPSPAPNPQAVLGLVHPGCRWLDQVSARDLESWMLQYSFETLTWDPSTAVWTVEALDLDARQPWRNCLVGVPAEHSFNTTSAPCSPSVPLFVPESTTREEVGAAIVVNPALKQSHVTAPWVQAFADTRAQAVADSSAAADSPSDTSSARTPIPAADPADVQAELGTTAPAQARLDVLADIAATAEI